MALLCFEVLDLPADPLPALLPSSARRAFVTVEWGSGHLSSWADAGGATGLAAGDAICQASAARAGLANAGRFVAWLSDATTDARDRLTSNGPWIRVDGVPLAGSKAELVEGEHFTGLALDASGSPWVLRPWTGTNAFGRRSDATCGGWTTTLGTGQRGMPHSSDVGPWTSVWAEECSGGGTLYCFED